MAFNSYSYFVYIIIIILMYAIRVYVCTCIGVEARLREVSRQLSLSELAREKVSSELEVLKLQAQDGQQWETEKQVNIYFSHTCTPCACINCYTVVKTDSYIILYTRIR